MAALCLPDAELLSLLYRHLIAATPSIARKSITAHGIQCNNTQHVQVTLLAAGFVIGPSGHSIRAICEKSGANIQVRDHIAEEIGQSWLTNPRLLVKAGCSPRACHVKVSHSMHNSTCCCVLQR
jgi:hypothetical protein